MQDLGNYITYWNWQHNKPPEAYLETSQYKGEAKINVFCTQLDHTFSAKDKKRIEKNWCDFFLESKHITTVWFTSRVTQELFDSVCSNETIEALYIKCAAIESLNAIKKLKKLKHFHIGSSPKITTVDIFFGLTKLETLTFENLQNVQNYDAISNLENLTQLQISGDIWTSKISTIDRIAFLQTLNKLELLDIVATKIIDQNYKAILELTNLKCLKIDLKKIPENVQLEIKNKFPHLISKL